MIQAAIERFAQGAGAPLASIEGLTREELLAVPIPGTWNIQQIVLHLMDSDLIGTDRMKRVIAEEKPLLVNYDENKFAERLHYDALDVRQAAEVFRLNRLLTVEILRRLPEADFARVHVQAQLACEHQPVAQVGGTGLFGVSLDDIGVVPRDAACSRRCQHESVILSIREY